ncbi:Serine/threonine-protein kinase MRCK beta [Apophysomyces ossiformis]|uniref:non-specific serine/threonine protein kinase n=1 Tax=Apophysomyces ossiformis TaxID=679940 RepID=A0A8H7EQU5_9FUNG|nr:Serine/threonine-protein kinase MRCK beta [Apophysomyces ossiformis]
MTFTTQRRDSNARTMHNRLVPLTQASNETVNYADAALDALVALYHDCSGLKNVEYMNHFLDRYAPLCRQISEARINKNDFKVLKPLAKGQFGTVSVVQSRLDQQVYAMKALNKNTILNQHERAFSMEERLVLSQSNEWMPSLYAAFQDNENLYLVMEYAGGGDLFSVLERQQSQCLSEEEARFYIAEIILAVEHLHRLGYVHRDIKPKNILIDADGHIKLTDFGSCIRIDSCTKIPPTAVVGTCDYVSPEVLQAQEGRLTYGTEVDWWSIGVVLFEMLQGDPPFYDDNETTTCLNILTHDPKTPKFKFEEHISDEARDLICKDSRLGINGVHEIKSHPFFHDIQWDNIRSVQPPFQPVMSSPWDTSNFVVYSEDSCDSPTVSQDKPEKAVTGKNLPFIGYTYFSDVVIAKETGRERLTRFLLGRNSKLQRERSTDSRESTIENTSGSDNDIEDGVKQLRKAKEQLVDTVNTLRKDMESMQQTINQLREEHLKSATVESKLEQLREENTKLKTEIARFEEAQRRDAASIKQLQDENANLCTKLARLKGESSEAQLQLSTWKDTVNAEREVRRDLQERLKKAEETIQALAMNRGSAEVSSTQSSIQLLHHSQTPPDTIGNAGCSPIQLSMWKRDRELLRRAHAELASTEERLARSRQENTRLQKQLSDYWLKAFDSNGVKALKKDARSEAGNTRLSYKKNRESLQHEEANH